MSEHEKKRKTLPHGALLKLRAQNTDKRFPLSDGVALVIGGITENSPDDERMEGEILRMQDLTSQKVNHMLQIIDKLDNERVKFNAICFDYNQLKPRQAIADIWFRLGWLTPVSIIALLLGLFLASIHASTHIK